MRQYAEGYQKGRWKAQCDRCGFDYRNHQLRLEWTGLRVCDQCFETRHPQDFVKGVPDQQSVEWTRPGSIVDAGIGAFSTGFSSGFDMSEITADDL